MSVDVGSYGTAGVGELELRGEHPTWIGLGGTLKKSLESTGKRDSRRSKRD